MKRVYLALLLGAASPVTAQPHQPPANPAAVAQAAVATAADIAAVRDFVARDRAYRPAARAEAERRIGELSPLLGTRAPFELAVARIVALADNGHSFLLPPQWTTRYPRSALRLAMFSDGLRIVNAPPELQDLIGSEVLRINGAPWRRIHAAYSRYQGGRQGFRDEFVILFMETPELLAAAGFGPDPARLDLEIRSGGAVRRIAAPLVLSPLRGEAAFVGESALLTAQPVSTEGPLYLRDRQRPFRFVRIEEAGAAYIQLKTTRDAGPERIADFLRTTLAALEQQRPRHIIVDLRFNAGGDLNTTRAFMQALPALASGRLYAITSGRTFSAAISSLGYLRQAAGNRLRIVGQPIGDRLEFWSEGDVVRLPGLGALMLFARERHNYVTGCPEADCHGPVRANPIRVRSLEPDLPARLTYADYAAGRDPAMDAILRDIASVRGARH